MKRYPKLVQTDKRGQIVIPKDIRQELGIEEGTGFLLYSIENEGILMKIISTPELAEHKNILEKIEEKADLIKVSKDNIKKSIDNYKKTKKGKLDII